MMTMTTLLDRLALSDLHASRSQARAGALPWLRWLLGVAALAGGLGVVLPGCATGSRTAGGERRELTERGRQAVLSDSELDITYVLGHDVRRFVAQAKDHRVLARSFLDKEVLKKATIDEKRYSELFDKAAEFVEDPAHHSPEALESCRTPFTVRIRAGAESITTSGCRVSETGTGTDLAQLARDAEFTLFSK